ncbi:Hypothetical protein, putative [Bodo saltans]|uniref:Uncharacterized protein n=1 Tax=Bodo saltans TaxID=75058 RepID=A0A0S4J3T6_BODSA|nr:Hypothetical protein, putative [Bodo saltans]|eukprot:CUG70060.1 Hypothetical protein, putative [Bodo saltans]
MKRGAAPDSTTAEQKIDDFKRAAAEFNTSGKAVIKKLKELSQAVDTTSQQLKEVSASGLSSDGTSSAQPSTSSPKSTGAPSSLPPEDDEREAWKVKEQQLMNELTEAKQKCSKAESDLAAAAAKKSDSSEHTAALQQEKEKSAALAASHEEQKRELTKAHQTALDEANQRQVGITSERDQLLNTSNQLRSQIQQMENAFRNMQETSYRERDSLNRAVRSLQDDLAIKEKEKEEIRREVQQQIELLTAARKDEEAALLAKSGVEQRLEFAEKKREGDFLAFEQATRDHERDIHEWQGKYSAAMMHVSRLKEEHAQLQQRLVDDHLREHIRVLQGENNQLREERVKLLQSSAKDPNAFRILTTALQDSIDSLNRDKQILADQITSLLATVDQKSAFLHDEETRHAVQLAAVQRQNQELEQRVRRFEAQEASLKRRLVPDDMIQALIDSHKRSTAKKASSRGRSEEQGSDEGDDDDNVNEADAEVSSRERSATPIVERVVETWERSVQVDDVDRMHLERELVRLRADNQELADDVARLQQSDQKQRIDMQDKLIQQMKGFENQVDTLERETKLRAFKVAKLQQSNEALEESTRGLQRELEVAQRARALAEHNHQDVSKMYLSLEMENNSLDAKVRILRREIEELHQQASEAALAKKVELQQIRQQQQQQKAVVVPRIPIGNYDAGGAALTPRGGGGGSQQQQLHRSSPTSSVARGASSAAISSSSNERASSTTSASMQDAIRKLDQFMLDLHQQTVNLDNEDQRATAEAEDKAAKRSQRSAYLEAARPFWEKERRQRGPNGESPSQMVQQIEQELYDLQQQDIAASRELQEFYQMISKKREQVLSATTKIIDKRNALLRQP